jgi:hypothetical protein
MERLNHRSGARHAVFTYNSREYAVNISGGGKYREGGAETDALVFSAGGNGFLALRAKEVTGRGIPAVRADKPISLQWESGETASFSYAANESTRMTVTGLRKPARVIQNGKPVKGWTYNADGVFTITLPKGMGRMEIR